MRKNNKPLLDAEQQLVFGRSLVEVQGAKDRLKLAEPGCLLVELLEAKIKRMGKKRLLPAYGRHNAAESDRLRLHAAQVRVASRFIGPEAI